MGTLGSGVGADVRRRGLRMRTPKDGETRFGSSRGWRWVWLGILLAGTRGLRGSDRSLHCQSSGFFNLLHAFADLLGRGALRRCRRQGLRCTNLAFFGVLIELVDFLLGHEALILQSDFAAPLVAVPQDEKKDLRVLADKVGYFVSWSLTEQGQ